MSLLPAQQVFMTTSSGCGFLCYNKLIDLCNCLHRPYENTYTKEIDLIVELNNKVVPIEIKAFQTMNDNFFETLTWFQSQTNNQSEAIVVYGGVQNQTAPKVR